MAVGAEAPFTGGLLWGDICSGDLSRNSCYIPQSEVSARVKYTLDSLCLYSLLQRSKRDSIAVIRAIVSALRY